jgi:hypothetical protein
MNPELLPDYSLPGEEHIIKEMIKLTIGLMEESHDGCPLRVQHAKATACVRASFEIAADLPADLQHGVFSQPGRVFEAIVRFSNAQGTITPDGERTARGLAIKLLNVSGQRVMASDTDSSQDFLFVDHPVFPFPNPAEYRDVIKHKSVPLIGDLIALGYLQLFEPEQLKIIKEIRKKSVSSPLSITYWSGVPYWLGDAAGTAGQAVKYSAVPPVLAAGPEHPEKMPPDYLREAIAKQLAAREAVFDFKVQRQGDALKMPLEDASVLWDEQQSAPVKVATLRISKQAVNSSSELEQRCEGMFFNPWHALKEHRPLGGLNRLRKAVYEASFAERERRKAA